MFVQREVESMPVKARVKPNYYKDSVALMRVAQQVLAAPGVSRATLVMGTPANKDILAQAGLLQPGLEDAKPSDLLIVVEATDAALAPAMQAIEALLAGGAGAKASRERAEMAPRSIGMALDRLRAATLAQVSVPGPYAAAEALKAVKRGLHVFLFSDNVPLAEEIAVKRVAQRKGLLVMGPDCGTAIVDGVPLGFANVVRRGRIGLVGASGTGLQEVTTQIHARGEGISHALGTGSRDVYADVGGITMRQGLALLAQDDATRVIVVVSKPPETTVAQAVLADAASAGKPVVVLFLGLDPAAVQAARNVHPVATLEEAAVAAVALAQGRPPGGVHPEVPSVEAPRFAQSQRYLRGLFSGGTFCTEAQLVWKAAGIHAWSNAPADRKYALPHLAPSREHTAIDLGSDEFTVGRPHPMIDQGMRLERIAAEARDPSTAVILLDVVLGYGANADPAGELAPAIRDARVAAAKDGRDLAVVAFVCGTEEDPQRLAAQRAKLAEAGAILAPSSTAAAMLAARLVSRAAVTA